MKSFSDAEVDFAFKNLPRVIQEKLDGGEISDMVVDLGKKYGLHIDKIGLLAELNRNMLLGLATPQELYQDLVGAGIVDVDAKQILAEINEQIFVPLREEMRNQGSSAPQPVKPSPPPRLQPMHVAVPNYAPPPPPPSVPTPAPASTPATTPAPASVPVPRLNDIAASISTFTKPPTHFHLENRLAPPPRGTAPNTVKTTTQTSVSNAKLLEDHEEPHIEFHKEPLTHIEPRTAPPPPNLPGVAAPTPTPVAPPAPPQPKKPFYAKDPYHEPIEEP